ncbi:3-mercaptopyruvate sulfurtransferase [Proteus myxofaciens]|uniref:Thiosulfate sulfurtransferase n=1 Tax=Proteus myxofaciens ATCC 19692 TaxID=1354337 RepID=A0A198FIY4_9GAMM|nr:3-mercaptopyruvate sulfurtransferase [Proteus myxofaciens]OAT24166.1 thiosulfate sulfurtransferase [Proteus myxofaciens ATCC 19692]
MGSDYFVTPKWLFEHQQDADLVILDVSAPMPTQNIDYHQCYLEQHLPNAHFFNLDEIADKTTSLPHMLPSDALFSDTLTQLGITNTTTVILYDQGNLFSAPRGWWTFTTLGCQNVRILAGGLQGWINAGFAVEQGKISTTPAKTPFIAHRHSSRRADKEALIENLATNHAQVVDARSADRFYARAPEPRPGLRGGHIPKSKNVPWDTLVTQGTLKSKDELKKAFEQAGVNLSQPIIVTCGSGMTAAILFLALAVLGHSSLSLYDGSWAQWGDENNTLPCSC